VKSVPNYEKRLTKTRTLNPLTSLPLTTENVTATLKAQLVGTTRIDAVITACRISGKSFSVTTDYEKALRNAFKIMYPKAQLIGCWFHFAQALRRKVKKITGLAKFLKSNVAAEKLYRKFVN